MWSHESFACSKPELAALSWLPRCSCRPGKQFYFLRHPDRTSQLRAKLFPRDVDNTLQLHGQAHTPLDLQLSAHEGHLWFHFTLCNSQEVFVLHGYCQVRLWAGVNIQCKRHPSRRGANCVSANWNRPRRPLRAGSTTFCVSVRGTAGPRTFLTRPSPTLPSPFFRSV